MVIVANVERDPDSLLFLAVCSGLLNAYRVGSIGG
jgi:hypothetical protein